MVGEWRIGVAPDGHPRILAFRQGEALRTFADIGSVSEFVRTLTHGPPTSPAASPTGDAFAMGLSYVIAALLLAGIVTIFLPSPGASFLVVLAIAVMGGGAWSAYYWSRSDERRAALDDRARRWRNQEQLKLEHKQLRKGHLKDPRALSRAGVRLEAGGLACPRCRGTQFKEKRSRGGKIAAGTVGVAIAGPLGAAGALAARKKRVRCVTCGTEYLRG